jgi:hypothetical protein
MLNFEQLTLICMNKLLLSTNEFISENNLYSIGIGNKASVQTIDRRISRSSDHHPADHGRRGIEVR